MSKLCKSKSFHPECEKSPRPEVANAPTGHPAVGPGHRESLLAAAQAGDRAALDELLAAQRARAIASARRVVHNLDDAEDAVQDAFVRVWRQLPRFEGRSSFATWVHRIVINASLDLLRRCATRAEHVEWTEQQHGQPERVGAEPAGEHTPESELGAREIGTLVRRAVAELPPAHRQAVELHELEDWSCQDIAVLAGCPVGTVMSRLFMARARLADALPPDMREAA